PRTKKFEVFADGTSNPWGVDWNERGEAFVSACVIHHLFHMAPAGQYNRQGGTWANPFGYVQDLPSKGLPAIVDWRHYRAAHSGICIYQGDQWPSEWRGLVFLGNIHQSAINCDRLTPVGATYRAEKESKLLGPSKGDWEVGAGNFLVCDDHWFRPVSMQTGPDGALWIADWSDKYPCYQNAQADPDGVDRELGRIWRVVWVGDKPGRPVASRREKSMNLGKLRRNDWFELLGHSNSWHRRQAQRLLSEALPGMIANERTAAGGLRHLGPLQQLAEDTRRPIYQRLAAVWTLCAVGESGLSRFMETQEPAPEVRAWVARTLAERVAGPNFIHNAAVRPVEQACSDADVVVRAAAACAMRMYTSSGLTLDSPPAGAVNTEYLLPQFRELLGRPSVAGDFYYPHIVWMAMEPRVARDPQPFFPLLSANENSVSAYCLRRVMRRICDLTDATAREKHLNAVMEFLGDIATKTTLADAALDGLIDAFKSKGAPPTIKLEAIIAKLSANPALADKARHLATLLGDTTASRALIAKINDSTASIEERLKGIQAARETKDEAARAELLKLFKATLSSSKGENGTQALYLDGLRALATFDGDEIAYGIVDAWKHLTLPTRRVAAEVLVTRSKWSRALLAGVDKKIVEPQDISATARRALARSSDSTVVDHANRVLGRYRATGEDKLKLIAEKRKVVLAAQPDSKAGHEVALRSCLVCHKLYGEGADVGPDLTGVGRSTLDALLHNIIDPNEVIGNGFENTEVELKDGRILNGRIVEDSPTRLKLVASGPTEHIIARSDIATSDGKPSIRTSELSLMPEGLEQMPDAEFRNLIWFLLNPPQDNRPWTPALRKELLGEEK
ncbi:MAG TPA: PVC-type heme-binding CxxCH protein, partial [Verrucomicrobiae bacterium]